MVDTHARIEKDDELVREQAKKDVNTLAFWRRANHTTPIALIMAMRERAENSPEYAICLAEIVADMGEQEMAEVMRDILPMI